MRVLHLDDDFNSAFLVQANGGHDLVCIFNGEVRDVQIVQRRDVPVEGQAVVLAEVVHAQVVGQGNAIAFRSVQTRLRCVDGKGGLRGGVHRDGVHQTVGAEQGSVCAQVVRKPHHDSHGVQSWTWARIGVVVAGAVDGAGCGVPEDVFHARVEGQAFVQEAHFGAALRRGTNLFREAEGPSQHRSGQDIHSPCFQVGHASSVVFHPESHFHDFRRCCADAHVGDEDGLVVRFCGAVGVAVEPNRRVHARRLEIGHLVGQRGFLTLANA